MAMKIIRPKRIKDMKIVLPRRRIPKAPTPPPTRIHTPKTQYSRQRNKRYTKFLIEEQLEE